MVWSIVYSGWLGLPLCKRLIAQELRKRGWKEVDLRQSPKGDPVKIKLARLVRQQTTMTMKWIAKRLCIGTVGHLSNRMYVLSEIINKWD